MKQVMNHMDAGRTDLIIGKEANCKVCVTGGSGYLGSSLVKKLLDKGYTVHATLRNLEDKSKVGLLKSLPGADTKLELFEADLCMNINGFKCAIQGCEYVFHVATPQQIAGNTQTSQEIVETAVSGVNSIAEFCIQSQTVKRLIYTASIMSSSPLLTKHATFDYFKSCINESCWTPVNDDSIFSRGLEYMLAYTTSKTLAEKALLNYNDHPDGQLEVVTLPCGLVGGDTLLNFVPLSVQVIFSQLISNLGSFKGLELLDELLGSIPIIHIDDVCDAHIFCMEKRSMKGRFICFATNPTIREMATYFEENYPEYEIREEYMGEDKKGIKFDSSKLIKLGFEYKYDMKKILEDSVKCGIRMGAVYPN